jgi:hypothetical protein
MAALAKFTDYSAQEMGVTMIPVRYQGMVEKGESHRFHPLKIISYRYVA